MAQNVAELGDALYDTTTCARMICLPLLSSAKSTVVPGFLPKTKMLLPDGACTSAIDESA